MNDISKYGALIVVTASALGFSACSAVATEEVDDALGASSSAWRDRQGTALQAPLDESLAAYLPRPGVVGDEDPVAATGERIANVAIDRATLGPTAASGAALSIVGATFVTRNLVSGDRGRLRIVAARPHVSRTGARPAGETEYVVEVERHDTTGATSFSALCPDPAATDLPPASRANLPALPLRGAWDARGARVIDLRYVTFACTSSVAVKCTDWGYKPWALASGGGLLGAPLSEYHQACVRMARADYCGDGASRTIDGTPIDFYDDRGINSADTTRREGEPEMYFESGWLPRGATCLTKLRWSTFPLGGPCPATLPDPRLVPSALYCDDLVLPEPSGRLSPGTPSAAVAPMLYSRSFANDAALYTWRNAEGTTCTTTAGSYGSAARPADTRPPRPGYATTDDGFEGAVYNVDGPANGRPADAVMLYVFEGAATALALPRPGTTLPKNVSFKLFTGTAPPKGAKLSARTPIGFILRSGASPRPPASRELRVYYSPSAGNYLTTTRAPSGDYRLYRVEGYLPR